MKQFKPLCGLGVLGGARFSPRGAPLAAALLGLSVAAMPGHAPAAQWRATPALGARLEYNDNVRLTSAAPDEVWGVTVSPELAVEGGPQTWQSKGNVRFDAVRYPGDDALDSDNASLTVSSRYRRELGSWGLDASLIRDSTLQSELLDTGLTQVSRRRDRLSIGPSWTRALGPKASLELGYRYTSIGYDENVVGLLDYRLHTVSGEWALQRTPLTQLQLAAYGSRFQTDDGTNRFDDLGIHGGVTHQFLDRVSGTLSLGVRETASWVRLGVAPFTIVRHEEGTGGVAQAQLSARLERTTLQGTVSREVQPSGAGYLQLQDRLMLSARRQISPVLWASLSGNAYWNEALGGVPANLDRRFYAIEPRLHWRPARAWDLDAFYRYRYQKYVSATDAAKGSVLGVSLRYQWLN